MVISHLVIRNYHRCNCLPDDLTLLQILNPEIRTMKKIFLLLSVFILLAVSQTNAQCAMCKRTAETNIESQHKQSAGKSLNSGILYLLSIPYLIGAVGAIAWYRNRKNGN